MSRKFVASAMLAAQVAVFGATPGNAPQFPMTGMRIVNVSTVSLNREAATEARQKEGRAVLARPGS